MAGATYYHNDMNTELRTTGQTARALGTTVPRILRAIDRHRVPVIRRGNRTLLDERALAELRGLLGAEPEVAGRSRSELRVLAALSRAPRGLASLRAVARRARVSPATADVVLSRLVAEGLVTRRRGRLALGRVREVELWTLERRSPPWLEIASLVGRVHLPLRDPGDDPLPSRVPARLGHVFWNQPVYRLDPARDGPLLATRILRHGGPEALSWAARHLPPSAFREAARKPRALTAAERSVAQALAGSGS